MHKLISLSGVAGSIPWTDRINDCEENESRARSFLFTTNEMSVSNALNTQLLVLLSGGKDPTSQWNY